MDHKSQRPLFAGDTHANRSPLPGKEQARQMTAISGRRCIELLKLSGQDGSLPRMLLDTPTWASTKCYLTWRAEATPAGRLLFRLVPSMPRTDEIESGLWLTPTPTEVMWPTPNASDHRDRGNLSNPAIQRRQRIGKQLNLSMVADPTSGSLNPQWVEWLMGFPVGWTDLAD
jgi:hypothetical protein